MAVDYDDCLIYREGHVRTTVIVKDPMRQLVLSSPGELQWREAEPPRLSDPRAAIVRPLAVGVCDFDRAVVTGRYKALTCPIPIGHEIVAEVVETGAQVATITPGMQVILPLHISCGACRPCAAGRTNSCEQRPPLSNYGLGPRGGDWGGGMSDLLLVPYADAMAVPVPAGLSPTDCAAIGCNLADMYRTIAPYVASDPGRPVLIVSGQASNMALYGIVIARALGVASIDVADSSRTRLEAAEALGAKAVDISDRKARELYSVVVDCSGEPEGLAFALSRVAPDGVCHGVWPHAESMSLPLGAMFMRNVTFVTGQPHVRTHIGPVLDLMQARTFSSVSIPVEIHPWHEAPDAFGFGEMKRIFVRP